MQPGDSNAVSWIMRRSLLAVGVVLSVACTEDVGGGPSFGSGSGAPTGAGTMSSGTGDASGPSGTAGAESSTAESSTSSTLGETGGTQSGPTTNDSDASTGGADPTTSGGTTAADPTVDPTAESSGDTSGDTASGTPLDPELDVPDEGESCSFPGSLNECAGVATVCRFYTAEEGRCESCDNCGNLNAPCTNGTDCDILFSCFAGRCTNFCQLGTFSCGPVEDCLDIGHATHGVCDPFA